MKYFYLLTTLLTFYSSGMAQVPLKVWDRVIGTAGNEAVQHTMYGHGFNLVKMSYGMALIYTSYGSDQSGNINTDPNPGNKMTGVVFGMNHDGSKRFDKRFLAQNCASGNCNVDHYTGFNYEYLYDGVEKSSTGNLLVSGYLNSGATGDARFITHYEINSNGQTVFAKRLLEPYISSLSDVLIKHYAGPITEDGNTYTSQSFLFTGTASSGGINNYIHDDRRTLPYNVSCFNVGDPNIGNIGFIRRNTSYIADEGGASSTNKANIMGERGIDMPVKVLSADDKFSPDRLEFLVCGATSSRNNCFWSSPAKGGMDVMLVEVDKSFNKVREIRIGSTGNEQIFLEDVVFTKDGNILVLTSHGGGSTGASGGDFSLDCGSGRLTKFTRNGVKLWEKCVSVASFYPKLIAEEDGGFMVFDIYGGSSYRSRGNTGLTDITIRKFNDAGEPAWEYRFGSNLREQANALAVADLGNGEYAFATDVSNDPGAVSGDRTAAPIGGSNDIWVLKFKNYPRHSIAINNLDKSEYVPGMYGTISYSLPANYNYDNQFIAELSDASGSFSASTFIGVANTVSAGTIPINIPNVVPPGSNYRVRIRSTEPRDTSLPSAPFAILPVPANPSDSLALVSLYNSTNGANWTSHSNWKTSNPLKTWYGVTLNDAGRVTEIVLYDNNLEGNIPDAITGLSELRYLSLSQNKLKGVIPSSIGNLLQLRTLDLSYNPEINGSIPASIGNLINLDFLWLGANNSSQLSGSLPASLGNLPKIKRLIIAGTQISGAIPAELGNLTKVEYLRLNNNQLSGSIPASLGNLITLTDGLDLADNRLTGSIPASLGNLTNIKQIWLNNNQLSGAIPSSLTNLTQVTPGSFGIKVSNNRFNFDGLSASILPLLSGARLEFLPQPPLVINKNGCTLSVTAGGNLANNTYTWLMHNRLDVVITGDSTRSDHQAGMYRVQVQNSEVPGITLSSNWIDVSGIVPDEPQELMATSEQTDADGWTHYDHIFTNDEGIPVDYVRLLSLKKNGNDIGTIGDGTLQVKLAATSGAGSGEGLLLTNPLITNTSGTYVMHRYWSVIPTHQPSNPVGVRFYFNDADINDVKGSVPWVVNASGLFFYKSVGGDPNPETNLSGATAIIGIYEGASPGTESYVYEDLGCGIHRVEYMVRSFSGGGGGGTVNGLALPVKLTDFSGVYDNAQTLLKWITAQEIQASHFVVERSYNGAVFSPIGQVKAAGNSSTEQRYSFIDAEVKTTSRMVYYRLLMTDFDGKSEYSKVISISLPNTGMPVKIGPNPAGNRLTIYLPATGYNRATRIGIYTMQGKQIVQQQIPPSSARTRDIDITGLTNGMYILVIESVEGVKSRHVFIKRR